MSLLLLLQRWPVLLRADCTNLPTCDMTFECCKTGASFAALCVCYNGQLGCYDAIGCSATDTLIENCVGEGFGSMCDCNATITNSCGPTTTTTIATTPTTVMQPLPTSGETESQDMDATDLVQNVVQSFTVPPFTAVNYAIATLNDGDKVVVTATGSGNITIFASPGIISTVVGVSLLYAQQVVGQDGPTQTLVLDKAVLSKPVAPGRPVLPIYVTLLNSSPQAAPVMVVWESQTGLFGLSAAGGYGVLAAIIVGGLCCCCGLAFALYRSQSSKKGARAGATANGRFDETAAQGGPVYGASSGIKNDMPGIDFNSFNRNSRLGTGFGNPALEQSFQSFNNAGVGEAYSLAQPAVYDENAFASTSSQGEFRQPQLTTSSVGGSRSGSRIEAASSFMRPQETATTPQRAVLESSGGSYGAAQRATMARSFVTDSAPAEMYGELLINLSVSPSNEQLPLDDPNAVQMTDGSDSLVNTQYEEIQLAPVW